MDGSEAPNAPSAAAKPKTGELLLYGTVTSWDYGEGALTARKVIDQVKAMGAVDEIVVRVNSGGGEVFEGLSIFNYLAGLKTRKTVVVDGLAASIASVIAMVGDTITMPGNAMMMIHDPWNIVMGNADDLRREASLLDKVGDSFVTVYAGRTGLPEAEIRALMQAETWMSADEAVAKGFATASDKPVEAKALAFASLDHLHILHPPPALTAFRHVAVGAHAAACRARGTARIDPQPGAPNMETVQPAAPAPAAVAPAATAPDAAAIQAAERARAKHIRAAAAPFADRLPEGFVDKHLDDGTGIEAFKAAITDALATAQAPALPSAQARPRVEVGADARDKFRAGVHDFLMVRGAVVKPGDKAPDLRGNEFRGMTMAEIARASLDVAGVSHRGMDRMSMIKAAITHSTSDFPLILQNVAEKAMMRGYEEANETFKAWTYAGVLTDFKPGSRVDLNAFPALREVAPGAEYKNATIGERGETIQLATYGELLSITRQAIINDDVSAFTRVPQRMGRAAIRTVGNLVYAILTSNPNSSDGNALFSTAHANNGTGGGSALQVSSLSTGRTAMGVQKDRTATTVVLNITPAYLIVPKALEGTANVLMNSEFNPANTQRVPNEVRGLAQVVADGRLDAASAATWYLAANPAATDTIEVAYLDGVQTPTIEQQDGWRVDGIEFKVRMDAGVKALAWEGLYRGVGS